MKRFPEKRVVITGSGSGLGRCLALDFAKMGWKVLVNDIDMDRAKDAEKAVNEAGGQAVAVKCDVTHWEDVENLAETAEKTWGGADIIVNNAGVPGVGFVEKIPVEDWRWIIDINLMSVVYGCKAFIPLFKKAGGGHIVNIASAAGIATLAEMGPYNVTKAGVIGLSETLRTELIRDKIGVTVACPTFFKTNLMDQCRYTDQHQVDMANAFFEKSLCTAEDVSRHIVKRVKKRKLYAIKQFDARFFWLFKRLFPETYYKFMGFVYSRRYLDKVLGVKSC